MTTPHHLLHTHFGFDTFRPGQEHAITTLLNGQHTLVVMPTGAGKSLIYQLTALCLPPPAITLVLSPLIALMHDQVESLSRRDIPATLINSAVPVSEQSRRLQAAVHGDYRLIYVAPERLRSPAFQRTLRQLPIGLLVVDEAHCISQWGHDFRPDYRRIAQAREEMGHPLTAALTATATTLVQDEITTLLSIPNAHRVVTGFNRPNLHFAVRSASDTTTKHHLLRDLFSRELEGTAIVYTGTRRDAEEVAAFLVKEVGITARYYHAGLESEQRTAIQQAFMQGHLPVVVATNAFGMGIDRPDVRLVIHYNMPGTLEAYYQEAGRAGRDGQPAQAVLLYAPQDRLLQQWFIENSALTPDQMQDMSHYLRRSHQSAVPMTLEQLAHQTRLDSVPVRVALAHLEQAGMIQQELDESGAITVTMVRWDDTAVKDISAAMKAYRTHRQMQLDQMTDYAEANGCRRHILLHYFSDHSAAEAESCCDNCLARQAPTHTPQDVSTLPRAERAALVILDALQRNGWGIGRKRLAEVLKGARTKEMTPHYQQNRYYGRFKEYRRKDIEDLIEQLIIGGWLKIVGGDRPVLALTHQGRAALAARASLPLRLPGGDGETAQQGVDRTSQNSAVTRVVELGNKGASSDVPELIQALQHPDGNVRRLAASALGKIGDSRATDPLMALLKTEKKPQVRQYAVKALGKIDDARAESLLQTIANDAHEKDYTRTSARVALKQDSVYETLRLAQAGKCPDKIADERGLAVSTIYKHLAILVKEGHLALDMVVDDAVAAQVRAVIAEVGDMSRLTPLKERLPDEVTYEEIRCVVAAMQQEKKEQ